MERGVKLAVQAAAAARAEREAAAPAILPVRSRHRDAPKSTGMYAETAEAHGPAAESSRRAAQLRPRAAVTDVQEGRARRDFPGPTPAAEEDEVRAAMMLTHFAQAALLQESAGVYQPDLAAAAIRRPYTFGAAAEPDVPICTWPAATAVSSTAREAFDASRSRPATPRRREVPNAPTLLGVVPGSSGVGPDQSVTGDNFTHDVGSEMQVEADDLV
ncbi:hypothetical protein ACP70R_043391 [Stipagrostis hirtigluma subsp. patula]